MKNRKIIDSYNKINPDEQAKQRMLKGLIDRVERAEGNNKAKEGQAILRLIGAGFACLLALFMLSPNGSSDAAKPSGSSPLELNNLYRSSAELVITGSPQVDGEGTELVFSKEQADLQVLGEAELFTMFDTVIFEGVVSDITNIQIHFGSATDQRAIVKIAVTEVLRGDLKAGSTISVLLDTPLGSTDYFVEDQNTVSLLKVGRQGIFMPVKYSEDEYQQINELRLYYSELADYHFLDGVRYVFLETPQGLVFAETAYPGLSGCTTLQQVKQYISTQLAK